MGLLDGRVIIVTGGGRGLGRAHCHELARHGATVVVNDLGVGLRGEVEESEMAPAEQVVAELEAMGATAVADGTSVTDWDGMEDLVSRVVDRFGALHGVVNNAGFLRDRILTSMTEDDFDSVIAVHLKGTFALTRHACSYWKAEVKAGRSVSGRVVCTTSGAGLFGNVGQANYGSAKSAIATFTQIVALEMQRYGVTANALSPIAATRMLATVGREAKDDGTWDPLDPANASPLVAWLCSAEAGWLSGAVLRVDGNAVQRVSGWAVTDGYTAKSGESLTVEELGLGLQRLYGVMPRGLGG
ncbi:SDR family NAD(P)-dependent oxidoreductase [Acidiferrimicrobium sp. IK]|uniref:SDR family NAD(P)-dependent oxidoreductase n=1 Tax=Acidiferrimicrobium sp. IK TaxID=2871700 RepID=UPI0021CB4221|nr:SDR family NAD(P)-dependent oxidoreductase [Acidiferrimicrobium sp. IK]MCU4183488.1 SDR family NAD(P)-dependent oxidoreductase [Acidiferrimicrobium sp. IK]